MNEKEKLIKEKRYVEASSKNYVGLEGKFGVILKYLGKPILTQDSAAYEVHEWKSPYDLDDDDELPEIDGDTPVVELGKIFDGLRIGHHIEIKYLKNGMIPIQKDNYTVRNEMADKVLSVYYKGYPVYIEADGELILFVPLSEWEDIVEMIYIAAEKLQRSFKRDVVQSMKDEEKAKKVSFLRRLRERWGI